jgi:hypothetical protein
MSIAWAEIAGIKFNTTAGRNSEVGAVLDSNVVCPRITRSNS